MKAFKNARSVIVSTAFFLLSPAVFFTKEVKAESLDCVDKYVVSHYDSTTRCTYYQYFDAALQARNFIARSAPDIIWVYGGRHTYCGPLLSSVCSGT